MHTCALEDEVVKIRRVVEAFPLKFWCACGVQVAGLTSWCGSPMVVGCFWRCSLEDSPRVTCCWCVSSMGSVLRAGSLDGEEYGCVLAVPLPVVAPHFQRISGRSPLFSCSYLFIKVAAHSFYGCVRIPQNSTSYSQPV